MAGRLLGLGIIVLGFVLAVWNATDLGEVRRQGSYPALRYFISESLKYLWYGGLVLIVTEIVGATGGDDLGLGRRVRWTVPDVTAGIAGVVLVAGTVVTLWDLRELDDLSFSDSIRYFLRQELFQYVWWSALLIALAALADHISQGNADLPEEEEGSLVATEP
jgi:hypothetical protein